MWLKLTYFAVLLAIISYSSVFTLTISVPHDGGTPLSTSDSIIPSIDLNLTVSLLPPLLAEPCPTDSAASPGPSSISNFSFASGSQCFPGLGFKMPEMTPKTLNGWWCDARTEYAFVGFSYEVSPCQSLDQLVHEFQDIRNRFRGRYVRLYGACDKSGFYNDVVTAAWTAGLGVHALIWFGFNGDDSWKLRRSDLLYTLHNNPRARFVTRVVQFGSEPLFDNVLPPAELTAQVMLLKANLKPLGIPVTVSELAYGYQERGGGQDVLDVIDSINIHILPYFAPDAVGGWQSWHDVKADLTWFIDRGKGKKMYLDENGWPSVSYKGVEPNSRLALANVQEEANFFSLIDSKCEYFKTLAQGGVAWFAHLYSDDQEPGYGILHTAKLGHSLKFPFQPRTHC